MFGRVKKKLGKWVKKIGNKKSKKDKLQPLDDLYEISLIEREPIKAKGACNCFFSGRFTLFCIPKDDDPDDREQERLIAIPATRKIR